MIDITEYLNNSIDGLLLAAVKAYIKKNPSQIAYFARLRGHLKNSSEIRSRSEAEGKHIPPFLIASITESCNLFCPGCYARAPACAAGRGAELSLERWRELFTEARSLGVSFILLAGGEPLLRRDVIWLAAEFPELTFPIFTNGTLIDDIFIRLVEKNRNLIPVLSLEGGRVQTDARRGEGVFDILKASMSRLKSLFYGVSVTVTHENLLEVTDTGFVRGLEENGCRLIFYVQYVPTDGISAGLSPTDSDRDLLAQRVEQLRSEHRIVIISFPGDEGAMGGCLAAGRGFFYIASDGRAEPCPFSPFSQLNLKDCSLKEALDSEFFNALRSSAVLAAHHEGGCALFDNRGKVAELCEGNGATKPQDQ